MEKKSWYNLISRKQKTIFFSTLVFIIIFLSISYKLTNVKDSPAEIKVDISMTIREISSKLGVTGKSLARDLELPLQVPKTKTLKSLNISQERLDHTAEHILSHTSTGFKYSIYFSIFLFAVVFLTLIGKPERADNKDKKFFYPRLPYILSLIFSVVFAGFVLGKSPNPMEGVVKVFKSFVGLYPDPVTKIGILAFFILMVVIGNKIICGWACPFGALQELIYSIPLLNRFKEKKIPFKYSNSIRGFLFVSALLILFGLTGKKGLVIYHYVNPFNLFNMDFDYVSISGTIIIVLVLSLINYRPFCQFICPFGFVSWPGERFSVNHIRIDYEKCINCGLCTKKCPTESIIHRLNKKRLCADCFSCARCLNICPVDAISYGRSLKYRKK